MAFNAGGIGAALNGLVPQLQASADKQQQARQQAAAMQVLAQLAQQRQQQGQSLQDMPQQMPGQTPGGLSSPQGGPVPLGGGQPLPGQPKPPMPAGAPPPMTGLPTQGPQNQGGDPMAQYYSMIDKVMAIPNMNDTQKYAVLQKMQATMSPIEVMQNKYEMAAQKLQQQQQMLDEKMKNLVQLQQMRGDTSTANTNARVAATERGQDIGADNTDKRVGATTRGQDIRSEDTNRSITQKAVQGEENLKVKQQNADTASDRAGTYKYGTMKGAEVKQQLADNKGKVDTARINKMASSVSAENKKPFQAAKESFTRAASLYQSLMRPGATPAADPADTKFAKDKMDAAQTKMESLAGGKEGGPSPADSSTPDVSKLSDTEQRSFDNGKTWWHLVDGKPVQSGG